MKALDTNVLIRFLVNDDERQGRKVKRLLEEAESRGERLLVTTPVILETVWVLESSYNCSRGVILDAIEQLTLTPVFRFEALERVKELVALCRKSDFDLDDALVGLTAIDLGCETTLTFDRNAAKSYLFEQL